MAGSWIDSASVQRTGPIGVDGMHRDAILALPTTERNAALAEIARAGRLVHRMTADHACEWLCPNPKHDHHGPLTRPLCADTTCRYAGNSDTDTVLDLLGLPPRSDQGKAVGPPREPKPVATPPELQRRPRRVTYKQCVGCRTPKPAEEFPPRSYRCRACELERERVRNADRLAAEGQPGGAPLHAVTPQAAARHRNDLINAITNR